MSLGGAKTQAVNDAVESGIGKGVHFTIAAGKCLCHRHRLLFDGAVGNSDQPASGTSPASAKGAVTVGAADSKNQKACFSNYGPELKGELLSSSLGRRVDAALVWDLGVDVLSAVSFRISRATLY